MKKESETAPAVTPSTNPFKAIRRAAGPLCAIETADPAHTIVQCLATLNGKLETTPLAQWDILNGLQPLTNPSGKPFNEVSTAFCESVCGSVAPGEISPSEYLRAFQKDSTEKAIVFWHNAHLLINEFPILQGFWNIRDAFKRRGCTLVMLAPQLTLPAALKQDVVIITEPLPDAAQLAKIIDGVIKDVGDDLPEAARQDVEKNKPHHVDTLRGLSGFAAEQVTAMSVSKAGIDAAGLWDRKKKMIEQTPGLSVWKGGESFDDLGGLDNLKQFLTRVLTSGKTPVRAIGFIDEIEKGLAGSAGDTSGTSQDQLQVFLKTMQDLAIPGIILLGPAGTGKSAIAKAAGNVANCPVIAIDTGAMKGSLVGESEARIRSAMDVFAAVSQGKGLFIATCNKITSLPPELRRRFTLGTFFVDLPSTEEREKIWNVWLSRFDVACDVAKDLPQADGWTGAEIKAACEVSYRTGLSISEAAKFIVPVIKSAPEQVQTLRDLAHGRFISASVSGTYNKHQDKPATEEPRRKMDL
jgi:hypothetical protein